ncbi:microtubule-associated protein 70-3-like [Nicotiana tomentosiformis]|uniref:microtubule-associated protein 70-3-like n=1 Tax=Nicotiana tomentosiformis TaxID=4098 RepID=UPI00051BE125|nr:microtubule-associated protein 70-3-like [Nicotiana tomentosiformis]
MYRSELTEVSGEERSPEVCSGNNSGNVRPTTSETVSPLTVSASFKEGKTYRRRTSMRPSLDADEFLNLLHGSDPLKLELNRLENEVRDKDRELCEAQAEIKALRFSERLREKAVEEVLIFLYIYLLTM